MKEEKKESPIGVLWGWGKPYHGKFIGSIILAVLGVACQMVPYFCVAHIVTLMLSGEQDFSSYMTACMATCGTINLDYRSLYHHFENGCFMADCQAVVEIKNDLIRTMGECRDVTDQYQTGRSAYLRLGQLFMRLFAGLL